MIILISILIYLLIGALIYPSKEKVAEIVEDVTKKNPELDSSKLSDPEFSKRFYTLLFIYWIFLYPVFFIQAMCKFVLRLIKNG